MPDPIAYADIAADWAAFRTDLIDGIMDGKFDAAHVQVIDLPKDRLTVRPLARLDLEQRLTFEAATYAAAEQIESTVPRAVYSYRWWKRKRRLLGPGGSWIRMQRDGRKFHQKHPNLLLARTDVTAFYEHIDINILLDDLAAIGAPGWAQTTLNNFLSAFNDLSNVWGIPQGWDASGLLANLYLTPLDSEIVSEGFRHFRYSDDVYIFGDDWASLRYLLLRTNRILRNRHLSASSSKTKILEGGDIATEFENIEKDVIGYGVRVKVKGASVDLQEYFNRTVHQDTVSSRDLRFSLTQLAEIDDDHAVSWLLQNMDDIPHMARESLIYLGRFPRRMDAIGRAIIRLLTSSKLAIYPYAEQHLLIFMIRQGMRDVASVTYAWKLLRDRNKEAYVREMASRYLGRTLTNTMAAQLKQEFQQEQDARVRRSLLVALYESGQCSERLLRVVATSDPVIRRTAEYLKSRPVEIPLPTHERPDDEQELIREQFEHVLYRRTQEAV